MTTTVTLALDLRRPEGRAAMRAYLDAIEAGEGSAQAAPRPVEAWPLPSFQEVLYRAFTPGSPEAGAPAEAGGETPSAAAEGRVAVSECTANPVVVSETACCAQQAAPPAPAAPGGGDPERPWTDVLKRECWAMHEAGLAPREIAARANLRPTRVRSYLTNVRQGSVRLPVAPAGAPIPAAPAGAPIPAAPAGALVPAAPAGGAVALRDPQRPIAQDPEFAAARLEEMAEAERMKAVAQSIYPEMRP